MRDDEPDYIQRNRQVWDGYAAEYVESGERAWASAEPSWGIWGVPEADLHLLPDDLEGRDVIELGCGTAYVSAWLARRGRGSPGSTTHRSSWRLRAGCRPSTGSSSRCS